MLHLELAPLGRGRGLSCGCSVHALAGLLPVWVLQGCCHGASLSSMPLAQACCLLRCCSFGAGPTPLDPLLLAINLHLKRSSCLRPGCACAHQVQPPAEPYAATACGQRSGPYGQRHQSHALLLHFDWKAFKTAAAACQMSLTHGSAP